VRLGPAPVVRLERPLAHLYVSTFVRARERGAPGRRRAHALSRLEPPSGHGATACCQAWIRYVAALSRVKPKRFSTACGQLLWTRPGATPGTQRRGDGDPTSLSTALEMQGPGDPTGFPARARPEGCPKVLIGGYEACQPRGMLLLGQRAGCGILAGQDQMSSSSAWSRGASTIRSVACMEPSVGGVGSCPEGCRTGYGPLVLQLGSARHAERSGAAGGDGELDAGTERGTESSCGDAAAPPPMHSVWTTVWTTEPSPSSDEGTRA
jgi:hypothetical protein